MRRRLFDGPDQGLGEAHHLIEGVLPPARDRGACSLVVALELALQAAGQPVSYAELMGRIGAAFMLQVAPEFPPTLAIQGREAHVVAALRELGRQGDLLDQPAPPAALALCRRETAQGRPVCALGWGGNPGEWAVIAGFQAADLLGYSFGGGGRLQRKPPTVSRLILLGERCEAAPTLPALARAARLLDDNQPRYRDWLNLLAQPEPYGPRLSQTECFLGEQRLSEVLADARDAGAEFLAACLDELPVAAEEEFAQAAAVAGRLAEQTEELLAPPDAIQRAHLCEDPDWRQERQKCLEQMRALEARLSHLLRRGLWLAGAGPADGE